MNLHWPWSSAMGDVIFMIGFAAFFALPFVTYLGLVASGAQPAVTTNVSNAKRNLFMGAPPLASAPR